MSFFSPDRRVACFGLVAAAAASSTAFAAEPPTPEAIFGRFTPTQKGVEVDTPQKSEYAQCQIKVERRGKTSGWVVLGPHGQLLRRFIDSEDADDVVDQWRYYRNGLEVYRDIDSNANNKIDQCRWVNAGGTRWGVDANEDGRIDSWKILSAEEAGRVAVEAILAGDDALLQTVLVTAEDLKALGVNAEFTRQILESVARPAEQAREAARGSKVLVSGATWMRFDSSAPGLIPADEGKAEKDLLLYENPMAILDVAGQAGLVQIGEMVRVGEVWKLLHIPRPIEGDKPQIAGGLLMQPAAVTPDGIPGGISPKMREWLERLQKLDASAPQPADGADAFAKYNADRAEILRGLVDSSESAEDKEMWTRQYADSVSAAVQMGVYKDGLKALEGLERQLASDKADAGLRSYVTYRRLFADYNQRLRDSDAEGRVEVQKWWLAQLKSFVEGFPGSADAAEALLQLALAEEIVGNLDQASAWYDKLAKAHPESGPGLQAAGALHRLGLKGKPFIFSGSGLKGGTISAEEFRGKALLVLFWSTTCTPCEEDLPLIRALYQEHKSRGFEILGVNLDPTAEAVAPYMAKHQMTWPQIHEPGGQESRSARAFGIITLPTMILVDRDGKVISRNAQVEELKTALPDLLKP